MANQEHLNLIQQGVKGWNQWRKEHRILPDLSRIDLEGIQLDGANLRAANLSNTSLCGARLRGARLRQAYLQGANLSGADLSEAILEGADLSSAHLKEADLSFVRMKQTQLTHVNLSTAKGLETIIHGGPSRLGLHTLTHSYHHLPEAFLQGAGVTEILLQAARMRGDRPIEYPTCLISYATPDRAFVERFQQDLQAQGIVCDSLPYDTLTNNGVTQLVTVYDRLLLLISDRISGDTFHVLEKCGSGRTFRIFLSSPGPLQVRYLISGLKPRIDKDFTRWRDQNAYQEAFSRLLRDLKITLVETRLDNHTDDSSI